MGIQDFHTYDYDTKTTWTYLIPVGKYCAGTYNSITFINDRDEPAEPYLDPDSTFSNISLYEESDESDHELAVTVNGEVKMAAVKGFDHEEDFVGGADVNSSGTSLEITNNHFKSFALGNITITENTVLEFDYYAKSEGELQGIGFGNGDSLNRSKIFQLFGTKESGAIQNYNNVTQRETKHYRIPVGQFYAGSFSMLVFANENDATPYSWSTPHSKFSNIVITNAGEGTTTNHTPVAVNDQYSLDDNGALGVNAATGVLVNDVDEDGDALTAMLIEQPGNGSLTLYNDGSFDYIPDPDFSGTDTFTYKAKDDTAESNTATVTITVDAVEKEIGDLSVNVNGVYVLSEVLAYSADQDIDSACSVEDNSKKIRITGNGWKKVYLPGLSITENTILEFDFSSSAEGEIHGISLEDDTKENPENAFMLYGSQIEWANQTFNSYDGSGIKHYKIPVGQYFTGSRPYLVFIMDNDIYAPSSESVFSNIKIYEEEPTTLSVTVNGLSKNYAVGDYNRKQKGSAATGYAKGGSEIAIKGNGWKKVDLSSIEVSKDTILEFDFASSNKGEIHGIFLDTDTTQNEEYLFNLYGTQDYGLADYSNYEEDAPATKHYKIPVGQFYTGSFKYLVFVMDDDVENATAESAFSNIKIYNLKSK